MKVFEEVVLSENTRGALQAFDSKTDSLLEYHHVSNTCQLICSEGIPGTRQSQLVSTPTCMF